MNDDDVRKKKSEYQSALAEMSGVSPQNSANQEDDDGGSSNVDYYENLKNESYKAMLSKEVQASVAADQARKYTNNALMANGYGTQGLSESSQLGIGNAYRTALKDAQNEYDNSILNINQQQREEELKTANSDFETISALMSGATTRNQLDNIYTKYGEIIKGLDEKSAKQLEVLYDMYSENLGGTDTIGSAVDLSKDTYNGYAYNKEGKLVTDQGDQFKEELKNLTNQAVVGKLSNGNYIQVSNSTGYNIYLYYSNGQFYYVTKDTFDKQSSDNTWVVKKDGKISKGGAN